MTREKIKQAVYDIASKYHYCTVDGELNGKHFPNSLVFTALTYLLDGTQQYVGDPGWGKTTLAQVTSSLLSGIPLDLYASLMMKGSPGVFEEKLVARYDYGALNQGREVAIFQGGLGLDALILDEANRIPKGTQSVILEGLRTGIWSYNNAVLDEGKKPTYLTRNYKDGGNGELIPALKDRILIVTEEGPVSVLSDFRAARARIAYDLTDRAVTLQALKALEAKEYDSFKKIIEHNRRRGHLTASEKNAIQAEIRDMAFEQDAKFWLMHYMAEINYSEQYGFKRSVDPVSTHNHDKDHAGAQVHNSFSARPKMAAEEYAQGLAWLLGDKKVKIDHLKYVMPFVTAHRLKFTDDYRNDAANEPRTTNEDLHLAKKLVGEVHVRWDTGVKKLKTLIARVQNRKVTLEELDPDKYPHPLLKHLAVELRRPQIEL